MRVDNDAMEIDTEEFGGFIHVWTHSMKVEAVSELHCKYSDRIVVKAEMLTPLVSLFESLFYRYRQSRWRRLAAQTTSDA